MRAIHWLRSRQEERELAYWLSLVSYDKNDRSLGNRAYLAYLCVFFAIWIFIVLTFFAGVGAMILRLIHPDDPIQAAVFVEIIILAAWNMVGLWQATHHSPVAFSEQDAALICQMPVSRRQVVLRWSVMPWLKSAIPLWLVTIVIGFSLAEISLPGEMAASRIFSYAGYGLRAWAAVIPVQAALFLAQWIVGVLRLQKDADRRWIVWPVLAAAIGFSICVLTATGGFATIFTFPLRVGFGTGSLSSVLMIGALAVLLLGTILAWAAGPFSLSRAAQETQGLEAFATAMRYGFTAYAAELQTKKHLGVSRAPSHLPAPAGSGILIWKDYLQSRRTLTLGTFFTWFSLFAIMVGIPFLPDLGSRVLAIAFWILQAGRVVIVRLRSDLACWSMVRQLPIAHKKFLFNDLALASLLAILAGGFGLAAGSLLFHRQLPDLIVLLPGIVAAAGGMAAFDVIRRSRSNLLLNGSVPEVSTVGILLGVAAAAVPVLMASLWQGIFPVIFSVLVSLFLAWVAFALAANSYRNIDAD